MIIDEGLKARFWRKVKKGPGCWLWTAYTDRDGYGDIGLSKSGKSEKAHRVSYEINIGPIPKGLHVLHSCDNPSCVNPSHLFLGTQQDNMQDRDRKGRRVTAFFGEESNTAKLTESDVRAIRTLYSDGWSQRQLADRFGVGRSQIGRIVNKEEWRHID